MKKNNIACDKSFQTLRINASARSASCVYDYAMFVERCKKFVGGHESSMHCLYAGAVFFHVFLKI